MTKLKNSNCNKTQILTKLKLKFWPNLNWEKTQIVTKLKQNKLWQNSRTKILTKHKKSNSDKTKNSNCDKMQLKLWRISKNQIVSTQKLRWAPHLLSTRPTSSSCTRIRCCLGPRLGYFCFKGVSLGKRKDRREHLLQFIIFLFFSLSELLLFISKSLCVYLCSVDCFWEIC